MARVVVIVVARGVVKVIAVPLDGRGMVIVVARVVVIVVVSATVSPAVARINEGVAVLATVVETTTVRVADIHMNATSVQMQSAEMAGFGLVSGEGETKGDGGHGCE